MSKSSEGTDNGLYLCRKVFSFSFSLLLYLCIIGFFFLLCLCIVSFFLVLQAFAVYFKRLVSFYWKNYKTKQCFDIVKQYNLSLFNISVMPQFDWLFDVYGCVMSPTSGIYWVELGFINNYKEPQLWLVLLRYSADVASAFPWVVTYGIKAGPVTPCELRDTTSQIGS